MKVYNARCILKMSERDDKIELQHLITNLEEHIYVYFTRTNCETATLHDIFLAHLEPIKLLNNFMTILITDSTNKLT